MYVKLIIVLRFLWVFEECFAIKFVPTSNLRRIDTFLRRSSFHGESELMQNLMDDMENEGINGGDEMMRGQVLAGDFFPLIVSDENNDEFNPEVELPQIEEDDEVSSRTMKDSMKTALAKLPEPLQKIIIHYQVKFQKEMTRMMNITKKEDTPEMLQRQLDCNSMKDKCLALPGFGERCMMDCLTKGNTVLNRYAGHVARVLNDLCAPIGTDFATVADTVKDSSGSPVEAYLRAVKSTPDLIWTSARMAADSLPYLMVTGAATSILPMGIVAEEIKDLMNNNPQPPPSTEDKNATARGVNGSDNSEVKLGNPLCTPKILVDETFQMAQILEREPSMMDVILPGFNTVSNMVKYVPGDHQQHYSGFLEAFEIMTGRSCGLINHVEGGNPIDCNEIGAFPRPGVPMPESVKRSLPDWNSHCSSFALNNGYLLPPKPSSGSPPAPAGGAPVSPPAPPDGTPPKPPPMPPAGRTLPGKLPQPNPRGKRGNRQFRG